MNRITRLTALAVAALAVPAIASPAVAAPKPLVTFVAPIRHVLARRGRHRTARRVRHRRPLRRRVRRDAGRRRRLAAGTGSCEPATGTLDVTSPKRTLRLDAVGEVCGEYVDATYVVTHRFVGHYVVTDATSRKLRGTDGWISLILATEGRANVEVFDS